MLHPHTRLAKSRINAQGVFATTVIPRGTIIWRPDSSMRTYPPDTDFSRFSVRYQALLEKYSYWDGHNWIYLTDISKYINHSCAPNTSPLFMAEKDFSDPQFDVALRAIAKDEEITYDYAHIFDPEDYLLCQCGTSNCRKEIRVFDHASVLYKTILATACQAAQFAHQVPQPLFKPTELCFCGSGKNYGQCVNNEK